MKRFTETNKWQDPWFMGLSPTSKLLWSYLCDHCDNAGVVDFNAKLATFQIGEPIKEKHLAELGDRLKALPCGKLFLPKFVGFQFGNLVQESRVHCSVLKLLAFHGIPYPIDTLSIPYGKGIDTLKDKDKEKEPDKDKEKDKEGVKGEIDAFPDNLNEPEFKKAWSKWHEHLKQKRKPATIHARDLQLAKLSKIGSQRAIIAIHHSIEHNWQGIYEPTGNNGSASIKPNPRNAGIIRGPTNYATAKTKFDREREAEAARVAGQVAAHANNSPPD